MSSRPPRLVVLRALKVGDFLTGIPALRGISRAFPDHERILAAPARFAELIGQTGMHRVSPTPDLVPLDRELHGADAAVDLHGRGPQSQRVLLAARPRRLISFRCPDRPETAAAPTWRPDEHEVQRWCRMLAGFGIAADPTDLRLYRPFGADHGRAVADGGSGDPDGGAPAAGGVARPTIIHPGAASRARRWPAERFARVARHETVSGRPVIITGGPEERGLAEDVARRAGLPAQSVVAGRTSLVQLAELVAGAARVISGDTGIAHLATAAGTPSVVLFGPIPPAEWGPPPLARHQALWAGRRGDPHGDTADPGLLRISVRDVLDALGRLPGTDREECVGRV